MFVARLSTAWLFASRICHWRNAPNGDGPIGIWTLVRRVVRCPILGSPSRSAGWLPTLAMLALSPHAAGETRVIQEFYPCNTDVPAGEVFDSFSTLVAEEFRTADAFDFQGRATRPYGHVMRARGILRPPASGSYRFWYCGDPSARLYLKPANGTQAKMVLDAGPGSKPGLWDKSPRQRSEEIALESGTDYEIALITYRWWPGDHGVQVAWEGPGFKRRLLKAHDLVAQPMPIPDQPCIPRADSVRVLTGDTAVLDPGANDTPSYKPPRLAVVAPCGLAKLRFSSGLLRVSAGSLPGREIIRCTYRLGDGSERNSPLAVCVSPPVPHEDLARRLLAGTQTLPPSLGRGHRLLPVGPQATSLFNVRTTNSAAAEGCTVALGHFGKGKFMIVPAEAIDRPVESTRDRGRDLLKASIDWLCENRRGAPLVASSPELLAALSLGGEKLSGGDGWRKQLATAGVLVLSEDRISKDSIEPLLNAVGAQGGAVMIGLKGRRGTGETLAREFGVMVGDWISGTMSPNRIRPHDRAADLVSRMMKGSPLSPRDFEVKKEDPLLSILGEMRNAFSHPPVPSDAQFRPSLARITAFNEASGITPRRNTPVRGPLAEALLQWEGDLIRALPDSAITAHRSSLVPGGMYEVSPTAARETGIKVEVNTAVTGYVPLGVHVPPGEDVVFHFPSTPMLDDWQIVVGEQGFGPDHRVQRMFDMQWRYPITGNEIKLRHPYGGLAYLWNPRSAISPAETGVSPFEIQIDGVIRSPLFVLGKTTANQWREQLRTLPAPRAEWWGPHFAVTYPAEMSRNLDDPTPSLGFFNRLVKEYDEIGAYPHLRRGPERACFDIEDGAWAGYPFHGSEKWFEGQMLGDPEARCIYHDAGTVHELSHSAQILPDHSWHRNPYTKDWETTITIFDAAVKHLYPRQTRAGWAQIRFHPDQAMREMMQESQNEGRSKTHGGYGLWPNGEGKLYVFLRHLFPQQVWHRFFTSYKKDEQRNPSLLPSNDSQKRDQWLVRFSRAAGWDMTRFFVEIMRLEVSEAALAEVASLRLPLFMPAIGGISEASTQQDSPLLLDLEKECLSFDGICKIDEVHAGSGGRLSSRPDGLWEFTPDHGFTGVVECHYRTTSSSGFQYVNQLPIRVNPGGILIEVHPYREPLASADDLDRATPVMTSYWDQIGTPWNLGGDRSVRLKGTLLPDVSGDYLLGLCHQEACRLWIWPAGEARPAMAAYEGTNWWKGPERAKAATFRFPMRAQNRYQFEIIASFKPGQKTKPNALLPQVLADDFLELYWQPPGKRGLRPVKGTKHLSSVPVPVPNQMLPTQTHRP